MRGDGKGVAKGETQRGEKSAHHAVRHGVLFSLMGFPLRRNLLAAEVLLSLSGSNVNSDLPY